MVDSSNGHKGGNGFLLGVVLGSVATLLLTTKKGREILREVADKGMERFSDLEESLEREGEEYVDLESADDYVETVPTEKKTENEEGKHVSEEKSEMKASSSGNIEKPKKSPRRFFRGKKS